MKSSQSCALVRRLNSHTAMLLLVVFLGLFFFSLIEVHFIAELLEIILINYLPSSTQIQSTISTLQCKKSALLAFASFPKAISFLPNKKRVPIAFFRGWG